jgi:hypothetical protein
MTAVFAESMARAMLVPAALALTLSGGPAAAATTSAASPPAATTSAASPLKVWTQSVTDKVQPTTAPVSRLSVMVEGARASVEAYQVIVHAAGGALAGVNMSASDLSDGAGHTIGRANLTFFREYFIDFTKVTAPGGNRPVPANSPTHDGRIPDPLIPFVDPYTAGAKPVGAPFAVAKGLNQPVWVDLAIPANAVAGTYRGTITVTASGQTPVAVPVVLTVWNLTLPDMRTVTTHFKMSENPLIDFHGGIYSCSGSDCWLDWTPAARKLVKRYEELAHSHRIDTGQAFIPDPSNGCQPPTPAAWAAYDAAMAPYMSGSYWKDKVPSSRFDVPFSPGSTWGLEATCTQAQYTALAKAWAGHLKAKGWFDRAIVYSLDEPDPSSYPVIAKNSRWLQAGDPGWKAQIMDTTTPRKSDIATLAPALGIFAVCLSNYDSWWDQSPDSPYGRAQWPGLFAKGIKLWFYESVCQDAPYPTYATNTLLGMEPQMMKWGAWYEQASGFLMWDTTDWDLSNPWGPNITFPKTGDGVLIYPGNHNGVEKPLGSPADVAIDGPIASYRLKMIRAGLQDWALFDLANQKGLASYARKQVARAYGQLGGCTWSGCKPVNGSFFWKTNDALLASVRHNIAEAIAKP